MISSKGGGIMKERKERPEKRKMKPFLIYQYLMKHSDENNVVKRKELEDFLWGCDIASERRSIYNDIKSVVNLPLFQIKFFCRVFEKCFQINYHPTPIWWIYLKKKVWS